MKPSKPIAWRRRSAAPRNPYQPGALRNINLFAPAAATGRAVLQQPLRHAS